MNIWIEDNYYRENPTHIIGVPYQTSGRFGEVTKYRGSIDDLVKIEAIDYVVADMLSPWTSSVHTAVTNNNLTSKKKENIRKALAKSAKEIQIRKQKVDETKLLTFDNIDRDYNKHISYEEKVAFVWYMQQLGRSMDNGWRKYKVPPIGEHIRELARKGILCYQDGQLVPAFIYFAGYVYEKQSQLKRDKETIIEKYGEKAYQSQIQKLKGKIDELYKKRLTLDDPDPQRRLTILPTSDFALNFKINTLKDHTVIEERMSERKADYGLPDIMNINPNRKKTTFKEANLQFAFTYWLKENSSRIDFKKGMNWRTIAEYYLQNKKRGKDEELDRYKKTKASAKSEGKRLFAQFLANELELNDMVRIETQWNHTFNSDVPIDYDRVPIGFRCAKVYNGMEMDVRPEKREAIAFAMIQGSGCLAYGVGLGKTWCAIFTMAQFIENGWSLRPFLALPNQVYRQFMSEIRGILPHIPINDLYNLSDEYLENAGKSDVYYSLNSDRLMPRLYDAIVPEEFLAKDSSGKVIGVYKNSTNYIPDSVLKREVWEKKLKAEVVFYQDAITRESVGTNFIHYWEGKDVPLGKYLPSKEIDKELKVFEKRTFSFQNVPANSITLFTYEGFRRLGLDATGEQELFSNLWSIMEQREHEDSSRWDKKEIERFNNKLEGIIGKAQQGSYGTIQDLGLDMMIVDEAHSAKKIFTMVKGQTRTNLGKTQQSRKDYKISAGLPSTMALKTFMVAQYIQRKHQTGNVLLLTATPFTNSPLEIFSFLMLIGMKYLEKKGLNNIVDFFDTYTQVRQELVIDVALNPVYKEIFVGFQNLPGLQKLIRKFFLYKQSLANLKRPNKYVLPIRNKIIDGGKVTLTDDELVDTVLPLTPLQQEMMDNIMQYAEGKMSIEALEGQVYIDSDQVIDEIVEDIFGEEEVATSDSMELSKEKETDADKEDKKAVKTSSLNDDEKVGVRLLRSVNFARALALSPYLYKHARLGRPTAKRFVETSAKIKYVVDCIKSVKEYHDRKGQPMSGQVIYSNLGVKYFELIKAYLVEEIGFLSHEIGIIRSSMPNHEGKTEVQNKFLGRRFNPKTREYEDIPDEFRVKVLLGSATIQEGINLQRYSTCLYNLYLPWNPTDTNQLEGRIWRQGNVFKSVRIVYPLMQDSMDIFMFQKLEEKTRRINAIWDFDGNISTLKLEEFDPSELKYILMKDPVKIAKLEAKEKVETFKDDKDSLDFQYNALNDFETLQSSIGNSAKGFSKWVRYYRDIEDDEIENPNRIQRVIVKILKDQKLKDGLDAIELKDVTGGQYHWQNNYAKWRIFRGIITEPIGFSEFKKNLRKYNKIMDTWIRPSGLSTGKEGILKAAEKVQEAIEKIQKKIDKLEDEKNIEKRAKQIEAKRKAENYIPPSVSQRVQQFSKLNYLLSERRFMGETQLDKGIIQKAVLSAGETIKFDGNRGKILEVFNRVGQTPMYLVQIGTRQEILLETEIKGANKRQERALQAVNNPMDFEAIILALRKRREALINKLKSA